MKRHSRTQRIYNELGHKLYSNAYASLSESLFEDAKDLADCIAALGIPNDWKARTLFMRASDIALVPKKGEKFRKINKAFREAILESVNRRLDDLKTDQLTKKEIIQDINSTIQNREEEHQKAKKPLPYQPKTPFIESNERTLEKHFREVLKNECGLTKDQIDRLCLKPASREAILGLIALKSTAMLSPH